MPESRDSNDFAELAESAESPLNVVMRGVGGYREVTSDATPELVDSWVDSAVCGKSGDRKN